MKDGVTVEEFVISAMLVLDFVLYSHIFNIL